MEKEKKLISTLRAGGRPDLANILQKELEYDDFITQYVDDIVVVPGVMELLKDKALDAPHGMNEEDQEIYFDTDDEKAQYAKEEEKYNANIAEKQKLAEEYKRAHDDSYFNVPFVPNEYAQKQYVKGNTGKAVANDIAAKLAFASDFTPFPWSLVGPVVRTAQIGLNEGPSGLYDNLGSIGFDFGTSLLGPAKGAAKTGFEGIKHVAGPLVGKLFDTKVAKNIEKGLEGIDKKATQALARKNRDKILDELGGSTAEYAANHNSIEILQKADEIREAAPELADELVKLGKKRDKAIEQSENMKALLESLHKKNPNIKVGTEAEARMLAREEPEMFAKGLFNKEGNVAFSTAELETIEKSLGRDVLKEGIKKPTTKTQAAAARGVMLASKPAFKTANSVYSNNYSTKDVDNDYNKALDYIIEENKRFWSIPGKKFVPNPIEGDILYEAWKKWKQNN